MHSQTQNLHPSQDIKPMDERFVKHVLPVLMRMDSPAMTNMNIVGVGRWREKPAMNAPSKARLRKHLGNDVKIYFQDAAKKPCVGYGGIDKRGEEWWNRLLLYHRRYARSVRN